MDIPGRNRVPNPVEIEGCRHIAHRRLRFAGKQRIVVDPTLVPAFRFQREVEIVQRHHAIVDHHLIDGPRHRYIRVIRADPASQRVAVLRHAFQDMRRCEDDTVRLQCPEIRRQVHSHDFGCNIPLPVHELEPGAGLGDHDRRSQASLIPRRIP